MSQCFVCHKDLNRDWLCSICFEDIEEAIIEKNMNCISIRQPWAELILSGRKSIELRNWNVLEHAYKLYIQVPAKVDQKLCEQFCLNYDDMLATRNTIVGYIELAYLKQYKDLAEFYHDQGQHLCQEYYKYGFVIAKVRRLKKPIGNVKGKLGVFKYAQ